MACRYLQLEMKRILLIGKFGNRLKKFRKTIMIIALPLTASSCNYTLRSQHQLPDPLSQQGYQPFKACSGDGIAFINKGKVCLWKGNDPGPLFA